MNTFKLALDRLESRLQILVESSAERLFPGNHKTHELSLSLVEAVRSCVQTGVEEGLRLPNLFIILVHPDQVELMQADLVLIDGLKQNLQDAAQELGLDFSAPLALRFDPEPELAPGEVRVLARNSLEDLSQTNDVEVTLDDLSAIPEGAFLIVDGTRTFPLEQAVVNIGRRPDNHLVVDDPRVSRLHAQLRLSQGRFIILDLDSTGGTWVNGQRVNQHTLFPGDVISLSGVPIVFGQDDPALSETQEFVPSL